MGTDDAAGCQVGRRVCCTADGAECQQLPAQQFAQPAICCHGVSDDGSGRRRRPLRSPPPVLSDGGRRAPLVVAAGRDVLTWCRAAAAAAQAAGENALPPVVPADAGLQATTRSRPAVSQHIGKTRAPRTRAVGDARASSLAEQRPPRRTPVADDVRRRPPIRAAASGLPRCPAIRWRNGAEEQQHRRSTLRAIGTGCFITGVPPCGARSPRRPAWSSASTASTGRCGGRGRRAWPAARRLA